ncbi:MAG: GatB/YqeY domain-containing protein, partial [Ardenticatenales bacterium]
PLDDAGALRVLQAQAKQRRDSIAMFEQGGRDDLVAIEAAELAIIEGYLPAQLSEAEIEAIVREHVAAAGATSMADVSTFMGPLMKAVKGRADGRLVNEIARRVLTG